MVSNDAYDIRNLECPPGFSSVGLQRKIAYSRRHAVRCELAFDSRSLNVRVTPDRCCQPRTSLYSRREAYPVASFSTFKLKDSVDIVQTGRRITLARRATSSLVCRLQSPTCRRTVRAATETENTLSTSEASSDVEGPSE